MIKKNLILLLFIICPLIFWAQDTNILIEAPSPPIGISDSGFTYKSTKLNILDSFKIDSLKAELWAPFELPIVHDQIPLEGTYEKLNYDEIVKLKKLKPKQTWFLVSFITILILILLIKISYLKQVVGLIKALFNKTDFREHMDILQTDVNTFNLLQTLLKSAVFAQLLYLCIHPEFSFIQNSSDGLHYAVLTGIVFVYFSMEKILRYVFSNLTQIIEFNKNVFLLQSSVDLLFIIMLFPCLLFFYYQDYQALSTAQLQSIGLLIVSIFFVSRTVVSLIVNKEVRTVYKFLIITYLCTFEIFPFLIWVKILRI